MRLQVSGSIPMQLQVEVRSLVRAGFKGVKDSAVEVHVYSTNDNRFQGTSYDGKPSGTPTAATSKYLVQIGIPRSLDERKYPRSYTPDIKRGVPPTFDFTCWQDELIVNVARQAYYLRCFQNRRPTSRLQANRHAAKTLDRYRKSQITISKDEVADLLAQTILSLRPVTTSEVNTNG